MKKYLVFFLLVIASLAQARSTVVVVGGVVPAAAPAGIELKGTIQFFHSSGGSITVPSGASIAIVGLAYWGNSADITFSTLTLGGNSLNNEMVTSYASDSYPQGALYYGTTLPSAGSQTLSYSLSGATVDGPNMFIAFFGGTATSSVVQSSGQQTANSTTATTGSMAADSGDLVIAMSPQYDGESCTEGDMISFTGATEQTSNCYNNMRIIPAYAIASGNTTVSITKGEAYQINVLGAIVNKAP